MSVTQVLFGSDRSSRSHNPCPFVGPSVRLCSFFIYSGLRAVEKSESSQRALREHSESTQRALIVIQSEPRLVDLFLTLVSDVRYDDSGAVMRLLQSRQRRASLSQRAPSIPGAEARVLLEEAETIVEMEDSDKEEEEEDTETELSRDVIYEHQDENTLI